MSTDQPKGVTQILLRWGRGDRKALEELMPLVHAELRRLAGYYLRQERPAHTLQPTALVNEAYLRLVEQHAVDWQNRAHFFGVAAQLMRRILVDHARAAQALKRGGQQQTVSLTHVEGVTETPDVEVLMLHDALEELARIDPQQSRVVELRYFGGLTIQETAEALSLSDTTVEREWRLARAWLRTRLSG